MAASAFLEFRMMDVQHCDGHRSAELRGYLRNEINPSTSLGIPLHCGHAFIQNQAPVMLLRIIDATELIVDPSDLTLGEVVAKS